MVSTNSRTIGTDRASVWRTLRDGHSYARWVVGTSTIRGVDPGWPSPGSRLHNPLGDLLLKLRNVEALRRLDRLAERAQ